jgi:hypothetical protein
MSTELQVLLRSAVTHISGVEAKYMSPFILISYNVTNIYQLAQDHNMAEELALNLC